MHRWFWMVLGVFGCVGCGGGGGDTGEVSTDPGPGGACGAVTEWNVFVRGMVTEGGVPVEGAEARLEERLWTIGDTFGVGVTDASGVFEFQAQDVISVEGCWGTALDYVIVAIRGDREGERDMNSSLFGAINDGDLEADITAFPVEI